MLRCDDDDGCGHPPDRSVAVAVVSVVGAVVAAAVPDLIKWWREHRDERLTMERRIAHLEARSSGDDDADSD